MTRTIKVHELGRNGTEIREVDLDEAKLILEDSVKWGGVVADARTREIIWEIDSGVDEILVIGMMGGG